MGDLMRCWQFALILISNLALAQTPLQRARDDVRALNFQAAVRSLQETRQARDLSRDDVLSLYELLGIVSGMQGDAAAAREAFTTLSMLDPEAKLKVKYAPKVTTPFLEGKAQARERGPLVVTSSRSTNADGLLASVTVECPRDAGLAKSLEVTLEEDGVSRKVSVPWAASVVVPVRARSLTLTVEVLGPNGWDLGRFGPFSAPAPPAAVAVVVPPDPPPVPAKVEPSPLQPIGIGVGAVGLVGLGLGIGFGLRSQELRRSVAEAPVIDGVVQITRQEALTRGADAVSSAIIANIGFIAGGALAATGVVLWLLGLPPAPAVSVTPLPGGAFVALSLGW